MGRRRRKKGGFKIKKLFKGLGKGLKKAFMAATPLGPIMALGGALTKKKKKRRHQAPPMPVGEFPGMPGQPNPQLPLPYQGMPQLPVQQPYYPQPEAPAPMPYLPPAFEPAMPAAPVYQPLPSPPPASYDPFGPWGVPVDPTPAPLFGEAAQEYEEVMSGVTDEEDSMPPNIRAALEMAERNRQIALAQARSALEARGAQVPAAIIQETVAPRYSPVPAAPTNPLARATAAAEVNRQIALSNARSAFARVGMPLPQSMLPPPPRASISGTVSRAPTASPFFTPEAVTGIAGAVGGIFEQINAQRERRAFEREQRRAALAAAAIPRQPPPVLPPSPFLLPVPPISPPILPTVATEAAEPEEEEEYEEDSQPIKLASRTPMTLRLNDGLRDGLFGYVNLGKTPFEITLNSRVVPARQAVALIHEMLHVWTKMYKIPLSHENLHRIAAGIHTDLLPVIEQLKILTEKEKKP